MKWIFVSLFSPLAIMLLICVQDVQIVLTSEPVSGVMIPQNPVATTLAIGSMLQGLLNVQIRSEGGYYENTYGTKFRKAGLDTSVDPSALLRTTGDASLPADEISLDARLLRQALKGKGPNPCFEVERLTRNRLLALACTVRLMQQEKN